MTGLSDALRSWDGKSTVALRAQYARHGDTPDFVDRLLSAPAGSRRAATWLIKMHVEKGHRLNAPTVARLIELAGDETAHWETVLHCLQALALQSIPESKTEELASTLKQLTGHKRPFVRAWAYGGALSLSRQVPHLVDWADSLCRAALQSEPPSIRARLRQLGYPPPA
ncbi:MAG: hypothetical protein R8L07_01150 [Alphaproteobacteria bacterium]|nr:hypothetical protein [Alphaproteobacteria bacterium]